MVSKPAVPNCPTLYGPVQSRRHGLSLGINLGDPVDKKCTWSCLYCQCGLGETGEASTFVNLPDREVVRDLLITALEKNPNIDSITFAGNSESTAHPDFFNIVKDVLKMRSERKANWIVNCLSNGSELEDVNAVEALNLLDEAWIKLDCGSDALMKKLNRPATRDFTVEKHVANICRLNEPRIQTLLWNCPEHPGTANATPENLELLLKHYQVIQPKEIHITTIARSPAYEGLQPVSQLVLDEFTQRVRDLGLNAHSFL